MMSDSEWVDVIFVDVIIYPYPKLTVFQTVLNK